MQILYKQTIQGQKTRSHLLSHFKPGEELTRDDLVKLSQLTYDQVRRQTKNLCIEGVLKSRIERGKRYYQLRRNWINRASVSVVALFLWGAIPALGLGLDGDYSYTGKPRSVQERI